MSWITDIKKLVEIFTSKTTLAALVAVYVIVAYVNREETRASVRDIAMLALGFLLKTATNGDVK